MESKEGTETWHLNVILHSSFVDKYVVSSDFIRSGRRCCLQRTRVTIRRTLRRVVQCQNQREALVELEKQTHCGLKVVNITGKHVAFKVKTTSPKLFFVRPNTGVIQPRDSCIIRVTFQGQRENPLDMQRKDKFLLQSTIVNPNTNVNELLPDTFNKDNGRSIIEECKLRVVFISPISDQGESEEEAFKKSIQNLDANSIQALQRLKEERDAATRQTLQLRQELDTIKRRSNRTSDPGFSFAFAIFVGLIGALFGLLLKLSLS